MASTSQLALVDRPGDPERLGAAAVAPASPPSSRISSARSSLRAAGSSRSLYVQSASCWRSSSLSSSRAANAAEQPARVAELLVVAQQPRQRDERSRAPSRRRAPGGRPRSASARSERRDRGVAQLPAIWPTSATGRSSAPAMIASARCSASIGLPSVHPPPEQFRSISSAQSTSRRAPRAPRGSATGCRRCSRAPRARAPPPARRARRPIASSRSRAIDAELEPRRVIPVVGARAPSMRRRFA